MSHRVSRSQPSIAPLFLCISAAMAAISLLLVASYGIEEAKQTAKVFVPATVSQSTLPK